MANTVQQTAVSGWASVVGIAKEATYGTAVAPSTYLPVDQASISVANKLIKRTPIRKSKAAQQPGLGLVNVSGSIDIRVDPVSIGPLLAYCIGTETAAASGAAYSHTFVLGAQNCATISADYGKNSVAQYTGCKFDSLDLSIKMGDDLMAKAAFTGQTVSLLTSQSLSPTYTSEIPFESAYISRFTIDGVAVDVTDFTFSVKNNNKPMPTSTSGRFPRAINEMQTDVSGSFTTPYSSDYINGLLWGGNTGPVANGATTGHTVICTFIHPHNAGTSVPYTLDITLNNVFLEEAPIPLSATNEVMQQVKFSTAESTPGAADAIKIVLLNAASAAY